MFTTLCPKLGNVQTHHIFVVLYCLLVVVYCLSTIVFVDVLLIGKGAASEQIDHRGLLDMCWKMNLSVEILPTVRFLIIALTQICVIFLI